MRTASPLLVLALASATCATSHAQSDTTILVEAEGFDEIGGWVVDPQFMDQMGSPYLLAHGLGQPVADATTGVVVSPAGEYSVWVRTKDWVAQWHAPGAPGRFQVLVDGTPLENTSQWLRNLKVNFDNVNENPPTPCSSHQEGASTPALPRGIEESVGTATPRRFAPDIEENRTVSDRTYDDIRKS